jgi:hypothetical protein
MPLFLRYVFTTLLNITHHSIGSFINSSFTAGQQFILKTGPTIRGGYWRQTSLKQSAGYGLVQGDGDKDVWKPLETDSYKQSSVLIALAV